MDLGCVDRGFNHGGVVPIVAPRACLPGLVLLRRADPELEPLGGNQLGPGRLDHLERFKPQSLGSELAELSGVFVSAHSLLGSLGIPSPEWGCRIRRLVLAFLACGSFIGISRL